MRKNVFGKLRDLEREIEELKDLLNEQEEMEDEDMANDTESKIVTHETGAVEHERVSQPEINLGREREYEIGRDEGWSAHILENSRRNTLHFDKVMVDERSHDAQLKAVSLQALQNAVETANMVSKQSVRHGDLAIDRQWNVDEQGYAAADILKALSGESTAQKAISADIVALVDLLVSKLKVNS